MGILLFGSVHLRWSLPSSLIDVGLSWCELCGGRSSDDLLTRHVHPIIAMWLLKSSFGVIELVSSMFGVQLLPPSGGSAG